MSVDLAASYRFCRDVSRREAKNFYYSFALLSPARNRSMCALYAFMRQTDDIADGLGEPGAKLAAIEAWRRELTNAVAGNGSFGPWPGWPALVDTVRRHQLPEVHLREVIDGVTMDIEPHPFPTFAELYRYCYHVASAVGLNCIRIWGYESNGGRAEELAEACGIALQLTNIVRDVREDALAGRTYLPLEDLERLGVHSEELKMSPVRPAVRDLLAFEAQRAYEYYEKAAPLVGMVAPGGRPVLRAIVNIYRALLDEIVRRDYEVFSTRVRLPWWRKALITGRALFG